MKFTFKEWGGESEKYDYELEVYDAPNHPYQHYHTFLLTKRQARRLLIDLVHEVDFAEDSILVGDEL